MGVRELREPTELEPVAGGVLDVADRDDGGAFVDELGDPLD